eukprot:1196159-Prorocentrum_minimum.AAC.7
MRSPQRLQRASHSHIKPWTALKHFQKLGFKQADSSLIHAVIPNGREDQKMYMFLEGGSSDWRRGSTIKENDEAVTAGSGNKRKAPESDTASTKPVCVEGMEPKWVPVSFGVIFRVFWGGVVRPSRAASIPQPLERKIHLVTSERISSPYNIILVAITPPCYVQLHPALAPYNPKTDPNMAMQKRYITPKQSFRRMKTLTAVGGHLYWWSCTGAPKCIHCKTTKLRRVVREFTRAYGGGEEKLDGFKCSVCGAGPWCYECCFECDGLFCGGACRRFYGPCCSNFKYGLDCEMYCKAECAPAGTRFQDMGTSDEEEEEEDSEF